MINSVGYQRSGTNWEVWTHGSMIHYFWVHTVNAGARFFFLDPYFPISDQRELIGYHGSTFFFQFHMQNYGKIGSMVSNECQQALIGNHGSMSNVWNKNVYIVFDLLSFHDVSDQHLHQWIYILSNLTWLNLTTSPCRFASPYNCSLVRLS